MPCEILVKYVGNFLKLQGMDKTAVLHFHFKASVHCWRIPAQMYTIHIIYNSGVSPGISMVLGVR